MPALNFKKEFAENVEIGLKEPLHPKAKRQSIRALRKDGRNPRPGQTLYLYTGMRTKGCKKLGEATCKSVEQITIEENEDIIVGVRFLPALEVYELAIRDGFFGPIVFFQFFKKTHGLPFHGLLIKW